MRRILLFIIIMIVLLAVKLIAGRVVQAHADYARSEPAADSVVAASPEMVRIWFTQELFRREGENGIEVYAPDGQRVNDGTATIDDDDRTLMSVGLQPDLPAGNYTVRWFTLSSEDGHEGEGEFMFVVGEVTDLESTVAVTPTLETDAATTQAPDAPNDAEASPSSSLPCLGSSTLLMLAIGAVWGRRRRGLSTHDRSP